MRGTAVEGSSDPFREMQPRTDSSGTTRAPKPWWREPDIPDLEAGTDDSAIVAESVESWLADEEQKRSPENADDLGSLRDTRSAKHHVPDSSSLLGPLGGAVVGAVLVLLWQVGIFGLLGGSSSSDVQAALSHAGISSITAIVDGETAILSGLAESESVVNAARATALGVDGISQVRNDVRLVGSEPPSAIASNVELQTQDAIDAAGFTQVTIQIAGDRAVLSGAVTDAGSIDEAASLVLAVPGINRLDNRLVVGPVAGGPVDPQSSAEAALTDGGLPDVVVVVSDGSATLTGEVESDADRSRAAGLVGGVEGVRLVDNQITVELAAPATTAPATLDGAALQTMAQDALLAAGYDTVTVTMNGTSARLDGTVPIFAIGAGFFDFSAGAEAVVSAIPGVESVSSRLTLRGDGAVLRSELKALIDATPIVFESASAELSPDSLPLLDQAATIITSQPGLTVLIAGHTDTSGTSQTNQVLAKARAESVLFYLLSRGVPPYRLAVVSYGELFPGQDASAAENRRIEFEVGP